MSAVGGIESAVAADAFAASRRLRVAIVAGTIAISILMIARSQVDGDVWILLSRGYALVSEGRIVPYGNPISHEGGCEPGPATSVLVGVPLLAWHDYRAPIVPILASQLLAWWLADRTLRGILSPKARLVFFVLFGASPWRVFFSGFLWNPNYLFLAGAVHLATAWASRERSSFLASMIHVATIGIGLELHASAFILAFASVFLALRGYVRVHWGGVVAGVAIVAATLVPWVAAAIADPSILPRSGEGEGGLLRAAHNLLRGVYYILCVGSLSVPAKMATMDFTDAAGAAMAKILAPIAYVAVEILGNLTLLVTLALHVGFWRRRPERWWSRLPEGSLGSRWLDGYVRLTLLAACLASVVNPRALMMWHMLIVLHAALIPVALGIAAWSERGWGRAFPRAVPALAAFLLVLDLGFALSSVPYRFSGPWATPQVVVAGDPMVEALHMEKVVRVQTAVAPETPP